MNGAWTELLRELRQKVEEGRFEFSQHASDQSIIRRIGVDEVREVILGGEVLEDYPDDKYGPSCLILGFTAAGRALHVQCSYPSRQLVKFITMYEPDPQLWVEFRKRRRQL